MLDVWVLRNVGVCLIDFTHSRLEPYFILFDVKITRTSKLMNYDI